MMWFRGWWPHVHTKHTERLHELPAGERRKRTQRDRRIQEIGAMLTAAMRATILVDRLPGTVISIYVQACLSGSVVRDLKQTHARPGTGQLASTCIHMPCQPA